MNNSVPPINLISDILFNENTCIQFLFQNGIFLRNKNCSFCNEAMSLCINERKYRCFKSGCRKSLSIRTNSFFSKSKLNCSKIMLLGYLWLVKVPITSIILISGCSPNTITAFAKYFRELVSDNLDETDLKIGGEGIIVEIDETKLGKRKYNRGHRVEGVWVVGGIERTMEKKVFIVAVQNRSAVTLTSIIQNHVHPGSILYTDLWRGYNTISNDDNYQHETVNHSLSFVNPDNGVHTNTIEGFWNGLKLNIKPRNRVANGIEEHLFETIWRKINYTHLWNSFISALKDAYYD